MYAIPRPGIPIGGQPSLDPSLIFGLDCRKWTCASAGDFHRTMGKRIPKRCHRGCYK